MASKLELATLGGGCYWCLEAYFQRVKGIEKVASGYSGGFVENPTTEQVTVVIPVTPRLSNSVLTRLRSLTAKSWKSFLRCTIPPL
jgi:pyrrolidone-carboxylate peptidase